MITLTDTRRAVEYFDAKIEFTIGPIELNSMIERGESMHVIDVRSQEDYKKGHIPGAVNLPWGKGDSFEELSKDETNIVYCYNQQCHLAANACKHFAEEGFPVMELEGGFDAWKQYLLPVEK